MSADLRSRTLTGLAWSGVARIGQQAIAFTVAVVLARLLTPAEFGLVGMVVVFVGFASIFADLGFGAAIVQRADLTELQLSSIFWLNVAFGLLLATVSFAAASPLAAFYDSPAVADLTRALAFSFVLGSAGMAPRALLQRRLIFGRVAVLEIAAEVLAGSLAIGLALRGAGVWSLVAQSLASSAIASVLALRLAGWRPRLRFSWAAVRELVGYGAGLSGYSIVNYAARNVDNLLIGRIFGASPLGIYTRAYTLMLLPLNQVIAVVGRVMFPTLAAIQTDRVRVRGIYLRATAMIAFVTFPMMIGLLVVAEPFVLTVYGAKWAAVVPLLRILALVGLVQSVCNPVGWIYLSQGRTDWMFWWGIFGSGVLVLAIAAGVALGSVETVAWAYLAGNLVVAYPCLAVPGRLIDLRVSDVARAVAGVLACAAGMGAAVFLLSLLLPPTWPEWAHLGIQVLAGIAVYAGLAVGARLGVWQDIRSLVLVRRRPERAAAAAV